MTVAYRDLFTDVRAIVNQLDPVGLIGVGHTEGEYDLEIGTILPRLREATGPRDVAGIVFEEFDKWFEGGDWTERTFEPIGLEVWAAWERYRARVDLAG